MRTEVYLFIISFYKLIQSFSFYYLRYDFRFCRLNICVTPGSFHVTIYV